MSTEFVDSFGIYVLQSVSVGASQDSLLTRWNGLGNGNIAVQAATGSRGNPALWIPFGANLSKTHSHQATYTAGFRLKISASFGNVGGAAIHTLLNNGTALATLVVNVDGTLLIYAGNSDLNVVALSTAALLQNTNYYIEWTVTATGTTNINIAGEIWINQVSVASGNHNSGINNAGLTSLTTTFNRSFLSSGVSTPGGAYISDFYLRNDATRFGDVAIAPLVPDSDGGTLQWTPLNGGTHFSEIDEVPADGGTTYNSTATPGNVDIYGWENIPAFTGTVKTVQLSYYARKNDEGGRVFEGNVGNTGSEASTAQYALSDNYAYFHSTFDTDPATGIAWTQPNFNAKKFGIELVS